eukprot:4048089-Pleurochrysis_carterae.AAC.2
MPNIIALIQGRRRLRLDRKYTTLLVSPGLSPALSSLSNLVCQHTSHATQVGGTKLRDDAWTSRDTDAYPPDLNFLLARVIASLRNPTPTAAVKAPSSDSPPSDTSPSCHATPSIPHDQSDTAPPAPQPAGSNDVARHRSPREHFRQGLGA